MPFPFFNLYAKPSKALGKKVKMNEPLTIRNISSVPVELKLVERFDPEGFGISLHQVTSPFMSLTNSIGLTNNVTRAAVTEISPDDTPFAIQDVTIRIEPFTAIKTDVAPFEMSSKERMRLTFHTDAGRHHMYCPVPSPESNTLIPLDPDSKYSFTGIHLPQDAHITLYSSSNLNSWMSFLPDHVPLGALSIPGTHNSPTCHKAPPSVRCQAVSPREQLENGVRFFDLRVQVPTPYDPESDALHLVHAVFPISLTGTKYFRDLYTKIRSYLDANPSETLIVSLKREGTGDGNDEQLSRILNEHYVNPNPEHWFIEPRVPSLGESRGKIVLIRRFNLDDSLKGAHDGRGWGIDAAVWEDNTPSATCPSGDICVQDFYEVMEAESIDKKIEYCTAQLERSGVCAFNLNSLQADGTPEQPAAKIPIYINFLSASNFWNVSTWPEKIAAKVNPATVAWLCRRHMLQEDGSIVGGDWSTGVVVCDWVGLDGDWDLVRCIVGMNEKLMRT